jgi:hypothetical protein
MALGSRQTSLRRELKSVADRSSFLTPGKSGVMKPLRPRSFGSTGHPHLDAKVDLRRPRCRLEAGLSLAMNQHNQRCPSKL